MRASAPPDARRTTASDADCGLRPKFDRALGRLRPARLNAEVERRYFKEKNTKGPRSRRKAQGTD
eukprot:scaffold73284_cov102-Phaeocystis_antarctica.AAC.2